MEGHLSVRDRVSLVVHGLESVPGVCPEWSAGCALPSLRESVGVFPAEGQGTPLKTITVLFLFLFFDKHRNEKSETLKGHTVHSHTEPLKVVVWEQRASEGLRRALMPR